MSWAVFALVAIVAIALLIRPLVMRRAEKVGDTAPDVAVYQAHMAELESDIAHQLIGEDEAQAARREIERRLLAADRTAAPARPEASAVSMKGLAALLVIAVPLLAMGAYLLSGAPNLPSQPAASRSSVAPPDLSPAARQRLSDLRAAVAASATTETWSELGQFYMTQRRFDEAARSFGAARGEADVDAGLAALHGETLVFLSNGFVSQPALDAFRTALSIDPGEARARYYMALYTHQSGRSLQALEEWSALAGESALADSWMEAVVGQIMAVAEQLDVDPADYLPSSAALMVGGDTAAAAMEGLTPEERQAVIREMVDGLAARLEHNPNDFGGWIRLARSRIVLGEHGAAAEAFARADMLSDEESAPFLMDWAGAVIRSAAEPSALPPELGGILDRVLALEPDHADALWFAGVAASQASDFDTAIVHWSRLLELIPEDAEVRPLITRALTSVGGTP